MLISKRNEKIKENFKKLFPITDQKIKDNNFIFQIMGIKKEAYFKEKICFVKYLLIHLKKDRKMIKIMLQLMIGVVDIKVQSIQVNDKNIDPYDDIFAEYI